MLEEPEVPEVPEVPDEAAGAEEDLAFLCFLDFFFAGAGSVVPVSVLAPALEAAGWPVPELAPEVSLCIRPLLLPGAAAPDAPEPMVPEAPEVSLLDDGELGVAAEEPDAPLLPDMPELLGLDMLPPVLELPPAEPCASTTEDTDATKTSDRDRIVFNVMSSSLS